MLRAWEYDAESTRINDEMTIIEPDGSRREQRWSVRLYNYAELSANLRKAGLAALKAWGGVDGSELTLDSPRMVVLAEKDCRD